MTCWTDGEGNTTCGDVVPPEASGHGRREFDEDGIQRHQVPPAPTEDEIAQEKELDELRRQQEKIRAEQQAYDKRLLDLYPTIEDLVRKRESTVAEMDVHIDIAGEQVRLQQLRLARLQARAAQAERTGEKPPPPLLDEMDATARSISDLESIVEHKQAEKTDKLAELDGQLKRYRQLRPQGAAAAEADSAGAPDADTPILTAVHCATEAECGRLWEKAMEYARRNATTPVDLTADRILATAAPRGVGDIAITVTRQADREGSGERIFMDLQCADLPEARMFCVGPVVVAIRRQFREALGPGAPD
jgi:hypothetical protein